MLKTTGTTTWNVVATCDDCGTVEHFGEVASESSVQYDLHDRSWILTTLEVEHWRIKIAICPACFRKYEWLSKLIDEHTPEAYRRNRTQGANHGT